MCTHTHTHTCAHMHTHVHTHMLSRTHTCARALSHTHTHAHTHAHTRALTHAHTEQGCRSDNSDIKPISTEWTPVSPTAMSQSSGPFSLQANTLLQVLHAPLSPAPLSRVLTQTGSHFPVWWAHTVQALLSACFHAPSQWG